MNPPPREPLCDLQAAIEALYRIDAFAPVADFCVDREVLASALGVADVEQHREVLLIQHDGEETAVGLFIDEQVVARARRFLEGHPAESSSIDDACVAIEGVSHFVYFTYCSEAHGRPVSQIELELQAEVDKFLLLRLSVRLPHLIETLFESFELAGHLATSEGERYWVANANARRYARWLEQRFQEGSVAEALDDARQLYRKPFAAKLEHIGARGRAPLRRAA